MQNLDLYIKGKYKIKADIYQTENNKYNSEG